MPSRGNDTEECDNENKISNLKAVLGNQIPASRLSQILEASNGSLEHAIEIYFHQMQHSDESKNNNVHSKGGCPVTGTSVEDKSSETKITNRKEYDNDKKRSPRRISSPNNNEKRALSKQARLDAFFRVDSNKGINSPLSIQNQKDRTIGTTKSSSSLSNSNSEFSIEKNNRAKMNSPTSADVFDSSRDTILASKTSPSLVAEGTEYNHGCRKKDDHPSADLTPIFFFQRLCETLQEMTDTTKRLVKLNSLETLIREIVDSETNTNISPCSIRNLRRANALTSALELVLGGNTATPLNVSGSAVCKALQTSLGITRTQISKAYRKYGDLGDCAASYFQKKTHFVIASKSRRRLSILEVAEVGY